MEQSLAQKAVEAALKGNWKEATRLNSLLLKENPKDIDALNRLARAYSELGNPRKAKGFAEKVLKLDPFNSIATKALVRLKGLKGGQAVASGPVSPEAFLEEPGKTKTVPLINLGDPKLLAKLDSADEVRLTPHSHRVSVITAEGKHVGRLPDDISARLRNLISKGNVYQVLIKSIEPNEVKVFIRELSRGKLAGDIPSFPAEKIDYITYSSPDIIRRKDPGPLDEGAPAVSQSAEEESF